MDQKTRGAAHAKNSVAPGSAEKAHSRDWDHSRRNRGIYSQGPDW